MKIIEGYFDWIGDSQAAWSSIKEVINSLEYHVKTRYWLFIRGCEIIFSQGFLYPYNIVFFSIFPEGYHKRVKDQGLKNYWWIDSFVCLQKDTLWMFSLEMIWNNRTNNRCRGDFSTENRKPEHYFFIIDGHIYKNLANYIYHQSRIKDILIKDLNSVDWGNTLDWFVYSFYFFYT